MSNITQWQNSRNESFLFVRAEKGCTDIYLAPFQDIISEEVTFYSPTHNDWSSTEIEPATYTLILDVDNATEDDCDKVVELCEGIMCAFYKDYNAFHEVTKGYFDSAQESIHSLVRSLNLDPNYNYVVLKIEK